MLELWKWSFITVKNCDNCQLDFFQSVHWLLRQPVGWLIGQSVSWSDWMKLSLSWSIKWSVSRSIEWSVDLLVSQVLGLWVRSLIWICKCRPEEAKNNKPKKTFSIQFTYQWVILGEDSIKGKHFGRWSFPVSCSGVATLCWIIDGHLFVPGVYVHEGSWVIPTIHRAYSQHHLYLYKKGQHRQRY